MRMLVCLCICMCTFINAPVCLCFQTIIWLRDNSVHCSPCVNANWPCLSSIMDFDKEIDKAWKSLWFSSTNWYSCQIKQADLGSQIWISVGMSGLVWNWINMTINWRDKCFWAIIWQNWCSVAAKFLLSLTKCVVRNVSIVGNVGLSRIPLTQKWLQILEKHD